MGLCLWPVDLDDLTGLIDPAKSTVVWSTQGISTQVCSHQSWDGGGKKPNRSTKLIKSKLSWQKIDPGWYPTFAYYFATLLMWSQPRVFIVIRPLRVEINSTFSTRVKSIQAVFTSLCWNLPGWYRLGWFHPKAVNTFWAIYAGSKIMSWFHPDEINPSVNEVSRKKLTIILSKL